MEPYLFEIKFDEMTIAYGAFANGGFKVKLLQVIEERINKNLKTINTVFSVIATIMFLTTAIIGLSSGYISDSKFTLNEKYFIILCSL